MRNKAKTPTIKQLAELHAQIRENEQLSAQLNLPFSGLLFSLAMATTQQFENSAKRWFFQTSSLTSHFLGLSETVPNIMLFGVTVAVSYVAMHYLYQACCFSLSKILPNGMGYGRTQHPAYTMRYQLGGSQQVQKFIGELKQLNEQKRQSRKKLAWFNLAFIALASTAASIQIKQTEQYAIDAGTIKKIVVTAIGFVPMLIFQFSPLGPQVFFESTIPKLNFVSEWSAFLQNVVFLQFINRWWQNRHLADHQKQFVKKLSALGGLTSSTSWEYTAGNTSLDASLFLLDLQHQRGDNITYKDAAGGAHAIKKEHYITELHRVLLEEGLPVYVSQNKELYIGFHQFSFSLWQRVLNTFSMQDQFQRVQKKLMHRLASVGEYEQRAEKVCDQLNQLAQIIDLGRDQWDYYLHIENDAVTTVFYSHLPSVKNELIDAYRESLSHLSSCAFTCEDRLLKIEGLPESDDFSEQKQLLLEIHQELQRASVKRPAASSVVIDDSGAAASHPIRQRKRHQTGKAADAVQAKSAEKEVIPFGRFGLFRVAGDGAEQQCFPLHVPWLQEGRAFAAVNSAALEAFPGQQDRLLNILKRGMVRGVRATQRGDSRVGIQTTHDRYVDVDGKQHSSDMKIKDAGSNVRIFGRRIEDAGPHGEVLYYFDGPALGH